MALILRSSLPRPLTHNELDSNFLYLNIIPWEKKSYTEGQYVIYGTGDTTSLYYCEKTHTDYIYTQNSDNFTETYVENGQTVRVWTRINDGIKLVSGNYSNGNLTLVNSDGSSFDVPMSIIGFDTYVTGGTSSASTGGTNNIDLNLTNNDGGNVNIDLSGAFTFINQAAVKNNVGGIKTGETPFVNGKTLHEIIQMIFYPAIAPAISYSVTNLTKSFNNLEEIGKAANLTLSGTFTRGASVVSGQTTRLMGLPTSYIYTGDGIVSSITNTSTLLSDSTTISNYIVAQGVNNWNLSVPYSSVAPGGSTGPVYDDGTVFTDVAFTNSGTKTSLTSLEGVYPIYAATVTTAVLTKQSLVSMLTGNNLEYMIVAETTSGQHRFAIPVAWTTSRPLTAIYYFNTVSNQFDTTNKIGDWDTSLITQTIQGNIINYTQYTKKSELPASGARRIKLVF